MATTFIYALCEPGTRTIRYIGKTIHLKSRLSQHLRKSSKETTRLGNWLRSVITTGKTPDLIELARVVGENWADAERFYIRLARGIGFDLANSTEGGEGSSVSGEEHHNFGCTSFPGMENLRGAQKSGKDNPMFGKPVPEERRVRISAGLTGLKRSEKTRARMRAAQQLRFQTERDAKEGRYYVLTNSDCR